jgi:hypothetical protein
LKQADLHSIVSISGAVQAVDRRCPEGDDPHQRCDCRFAVENDDGRFSVQAILSPEDCDRLSDSRVQVIGTLRSTFFRQCHQHHQIIDAFLVVILRPARHGRDHVQAILRSESTTCD